jgi:hypothetical protein
VQRELINIVQTGGLTLDPTNDAQVFAAIKEMFGTGRLINIQTFTSSGIYTPTLGTNFVEVEGVGGGGSSSVAPSTGSGQASVSNGGGAGAYARGRYSNGFAGVNVFIGAGGIGGTSVTPSGTDGGTTSFGSLLIIPGGSHGGSIGPLSPPYRVPNTTVSNIPTGGYINCIGQPTAMSFALSSTVAAGSNGAASFYGGGGATVSAGTNPNNGTAYGSGASGPSTIQNSVLVPGANGASGVIIIYEYS